MLAISNTIFRIYRSRPFKKPFTKHIQHDLPKNLQYPVLNYKMPKSATLTLKRELSPETHKIISVNSLTNQTHLIRFERHQFKFTAGQYLQLGYKHDTNFREYSIYSGENDPYLEILIREIDEGYLTPRLSSAKKGDELTVFGPYGHFVLPERLKKNSRLIFIASGTGIAPFHSLVSSNPLLDYVILHGIRFIDEAYESHFYGEKKYISCCSQDTRGNYHGRVTSYLAEHSLDAQADYFLCGNQKMILDTTRILKEGGILREKIHVEVFF